MGLDKFRMLSIIRLLVVVSVLLLIHLMLVQCQQDAICSEKSPCKIGCCLKYGPIVP